MPIDELMARIRRLPPSKRQQIEEMVRSLEDGPTAGASPSVPDQHTTPRPPLRSLRGFLRDLGPAPSEDAIDEARREMWGTFPREDPP